MSADARDLSPLKRAVLALDEMKAKLDAVERQHSEPIAIIGIGCRFPGADGPDAFWQLLRTGTNAITEIPSDRWRVDDYYDADPTVAGKMYTRWGGFVDRVDGFDPQVFGIAPREAAGMDPQQRLLLEVSWEALEHASQAPDRLSGSATGVFVGICTFDYAMLGSKTNDPGRIDAYTASGIAHSIASGRISYVFGLQGPSVSVDTACSSSLVSIHLACQSLRAQECAMALAGGVHLNLGPDNSICFSRNRMLASDGRCKTFDAAADGFVEGEGCGIVVLKRLSDAMANGDRVVAVIRGSALNQDGPSSGLTAPNGPAQEAVIRAALAAGRVPLARVSYIEAHGTGTSLGDPIEVQALGAVFGAGRTKERPLVVGAVKTNIGHVQAASGIAGLIKVVLALQHAEIPANLHLVNPSPHIPWARLPIAVPTEPIPWVSEGPRVAGVSAFGFSGTNAHVVLEQAPAVQPADATNAQRPLHIFTMSARTGTALRDLAGNWAAAVRSGGLDTGDVCFTANAGRAGLQRRMAVVVDGVDALHDSLAAFADGRTAADVVVGQADPADRPRIAFLFTGQGSQYLGMGRQLYDTQPAFRGAIDRCDALLAPLVGRSVRDVMHGTDEALLTGTAFAQPALFALEYAMAGLWRSWGVEPTAVIGHSLGEYVAACLAGVFSLEDALTLVAARGRLMQGLEASGAMAAVMGDHARVVDAIGAEPQVTIAAINAPDNIVISGETSAVERVRGRLDRAGIRSERLTVSHAFHSPLMAPVLDEFERVASAVTFHAPRMRLISNVTGELGRGDVATPAYWRRHISQPVLFSAGVKALRGIGCSIFLELGPRPTLLALGRRSVADPGVLWLPSLRKDRDEWRQILESLSQMYVAGVPIDWRGFDRGYNRHPIAMPTYPFERQRCWLEDVSTAPNAVRRATGRVVHPLLGRRLPSALREIQFEAEIDRRTTPYLADHVKQGTVILPATAVLDMGLAAAAALGRDEHAVADLVISEPLLVPSDGPLVVQCVVTPSPDGSAQFALFSRQGDADDEAPEWRPHGSATLSRLPGGEDGRRVSIDAVRARCSERVDVDQYYAQMRADGHEYGPLFQAIVEIHRGDREAIGLVELPEALRSESAAYRMHPVVADAALQLIGAAMPAVDEGGEAGTYLPVGLDRWRVRTAGVQRVWSHVRMRSSAQPASGTIVVDVDLIAEDGEIVASLEGMVLQRVDRVARLRAAASTRDWMYEVIWREQPLPSGGGAEAPAGAWLLAGAQTEVSRDLASRLARRGVVIEAATEPNPNRPLTGIVFMVGEDGSDAAAADLTFGAATSAAASLLHLVQASVADETADAPPRLYVVTGGAQPVGAAFPVAAVRQAAVLGLARTIGVEHPELRCQMIDLDPSGGGAGSEALWNEICGADAEGEVAYRSGVRHVRRLARLALKAPRPSGSAGDAVELATDQPGLFDRLALKPLERRPPARGEVEIEVVATGLNFRDVLNALGTYEGPPGPLGSECVGRISRLGEGVERFAAGDEVFVTWPGTFKSFLTVPSDVVFHRPKNLSLIETATIPITFMTAEYALNNLAAMKAGDRVLIHAAAGGVGLAAVQLAQEAGAEIFATVGSPAKRAHLESLGVTHLMDSRSLSFYDDVMAKTGGEGVDIVLNSLAGEFIPKSLAALRDKGRFIEIGKSGVWTEERVAEIRPDVAYHPVYLGGSDPGLIDALFHRLVAAFESGALKPLPHREFPLSEAASAFRYMAQARHIGKIVLVHDRVMDDSRGIQSDGTYLVTGGLGALGLQVAQWLVDRGARHVALAGRKAPSASAAEVVANLEARGAQVTAFAADVSSAPDVQRLIATLSSTMPPLRGVLHAAGVIDDGALLNQTWPRVQSVLAPKADGAWHLHHATRALRLDFFVSFSSMVSVFGAPGQGSYVTANAVLDAVAHHRRARNLPALSINWGPWSQGGMASGLGERERQRWSEQGFGVIAPEEGLAALEQVLASDRPQVMVAPIDWRAVARQWTNGVPRFVSDLVRQSSQPAPAPAADDLTARVAEAVPSERKRIVLERVRREAVKVLGVPAYEPPDQRRPLNELGLDSLMAVELRNALGAAVGRSLPATLLFRCPSIDALAGYLLRDVLKAGDADAAPAAATASEDDSAVAQLEDDEVTRLLAEELASLSSEERSRGGA